MVRSTKRLSGGVLAALLGAALAAAPAAAAADRGESPKTPETPELWEPDQAVAFLLGVPRPAAAEPAPAWDGALGVGVARALFGTYRVVLASQDLPVCAFRPSCSRFAERAISRCGAVQGALLSLDRLLRDHPLAFPFYPRLPDGHLQDEPERYCLTAPE